MGTATVTIKTVLLGLVLDTYMEFMRVISENQR